MEGEIIYLEGYIGKSQIIQYLEAGQVANAAGALDANNVNEQTSEPLIYMPNTMLTPFTALCALGSAIQVEGEGVLRAALDSVLETMKTTRETDWTLQDSYGCTYPQWAVWSGSIDATLKVLEYMRSLGLDINVRDSGGRNAIDIAFRPHVMKVAGDMVKVLKTFEVQTLDQHLVQAYNNFVHPEQIIHDLISNNYHMHGIDLISNLCMPISMKFLQIASTADKAQQAPLLIEFKGLKLKSIPVLEKLLAHESFNPNAQDQNGFTVHHLLPDVDVKLMDQIKDFSSINVSDSVGKTALHWFSGYNGPSKIKALCSYGANVNAQEPNGATPVHSLFLNPQRVNVEGAKLPSLKILLDKGNQPPFNPHLKMNGQFSVLDLANNMEGDEKAVCTQALTDYTEWYDAAALADVQAQLAGVNVEAELADLFA